MPVANSVHIPLLLAGLVGCSAIKAQLPHTSGSSPATPSSAASSPTPAKTSGPNTKAPAANGGLPDKNTDRAGWINASMSGKQADFCPQIPAKTLPGGSDPDQATEDFAKLKMETLSAEAAIGLAKVICKFPGNPSLQRTLVPLWQAFLAKYGLAAGDFTVLLDKDKVDGMYDQRIRGNHGATSGKRFADVDARTQVQMVDSLVLHEPSSSDRLQLYAKLLDETAAPSEHLKLGFVNECLRTMKMSSCMSDAASLDRARYYAELTASQLTPLDKLENKLRFVQFQDRVKQERGEPAAAEKSVLTLWQSESSQQGELLAWAYKVIDDSRAGDKALLHGCDDELQRHVTAYLKQKAPGSLDELKAAFRTSVGGALSDAAASCYAATDQQLSKFWTGLSAEVQQWGPRTALLHALLTKPERSKDSVIHAPGDGDVIEKVVESNGLLTLSFKKATWKEEVCKQWKSSGAYHVDINGDVTRGGTCTKKVMETRTSQSPPITLQKRLGDGLKAGAAVTFVHGFPIVVVAKLKDTKLIAGFGVALSN